ncbi:GGDEF domain-containing protein [Marinobacter bohaiensis]|uniref:GGDEF domain-containing protein n=1 Tax=Marinobacter bohaiensis TaxID=2201898 RepID=UPI000DAE0293|nr:sensor domain-containing diguanylate cyclase [Marinobacter bohaiensis]
MAPRNLRLHGPKLVALGLVANLSLVACLALGDTKTWAEIQWLDVFGEGGGALMVLAWLVMVLGSRPAGRVSNLMFAGIAFIFLAMWQDALDEFIRMPPGQWWDTWLESASLPIGMALLTLGLFHWHREQLVISEQLRKRERHFREHKEVDRLTQLASVGYLRRQLGQELGRAREAGTPVCLLMVDIDRFDDLNRRFGTREGDRLLQAMAQLIVMNIRQTDLVCRYAGDRFAVLLPNTGEVLARILARQIEAAASHFAYKTSLEGETAYHTVSVGTALALNASPQDLLERANRDLAWAKSDKAPDRVA